MRNSYSNIPINTSQNTHENVFSLLPKERDISIVDIPCGAGAFVKRLKDYGYKNVIGIDVQKILQCDIDSFSVGDMRKPLPLDDSSVDAIVCIDGIEHIDRQFDFAKECHRVLKPGGFVVMSTPNVSSLRSRWRWFLTGHHNKCKSPLDENNPNPMHHIGMISFPEMRYMLHSNGFAIDEISTNRTKITAWLYLSLLPFIWLFTSIAYSKTKKRSDSLKAVHKEIKQQMLSFPILLGETLIVRAMKLS